MQHFGFHGLYTRLICRSDLHSCGRFCRFLTQKKLENVATANALQLEAARRRALPIRFNFVARGKFEVAQPIIIIIIIIIISNE